MLRKAIAWTFAGQALSLIVILAATIALSRMLSPREVGIYAIAMAITGVLQALSTFGIGNYVVRERDLSAGTLETAFTVNSVVSIVLFAMLLICSTSHALTKSEPMVAEVLRLLAFVPLIGSIEFRPAIMLQREMDFRRISFVNVARAVAAAIVSVGFAAMGASAMSAAYGAIAGAIVGAAGFTIVARRYASFRLSLSAWRSISSFGFQTLVIGGISVLALKMSDLALGLLLGLGALGLFNRSTVLTNVVVQNVYGNIARVLFVKLADDERAGRCTRDGYLRSLDMILALMWPMLGGLALMAGPIVQLLFGERWSGAALPLAILAVGNGLGLTFAMNYEFFVLRDRLGRQSRLEIVRAIAGMVGLAYGCNFGLVGAAIGRAADPLVGMLLYIPQMIALTGASGRELGALYLRNASLAVISLIPALLLVIIGGWSPELGVMAVTWVTLACGLSWLLALRLFKHSLYREVAALFEELARGVRARRLPVRHLTDR